MNDGEVSLDPQPTQSTLPISPIFIASGAGTSASDQENGSKQDLMPPDLASVDLDTLLMPPEVTVKQPQENDFMVSYDFATFSALKYGRNENAFRQKILLTVLDFLQFC